MTITYTKHIITAEEVEQHTKILEIISETVQLFRKGQDYWGLCPFHQEKTASFSVSPSKGFYHCFGCHAHGRAIDYIMRFYGMDFKQAKEYLAARAGLPADISPAERRAIKQARKRRESESRKEDLIAKAIRYEWTRLINIEQWCHLFLKHIYTERCTDRPGPVWAAHTLPVVESLLNEMEQGNDKERFEIALRVRGWQL